jgi:hypothetical protein
MTSPAPHDEDSERAARRSNMAAIVRVILLAVVSYCAFSALQRSRRFQRCLDSGDRQDGFDTQCLNAFSVFRDTRRRMELCGKVGDGVNQAAGLISATDSIPSLNFIPLTTFGNWF